MPNGGTAAKIGYRYQDWCAMYFALDGFKNDASFEKVYCEQEKMDFEIWNSLNFNGFQVKTGLSGLTAGEINKIFSYYLNKSTTSGKQQKSFWFVFNKQPTKSLDHLFTVARNGRRGVSYSGQVKKFIDTALSGIPVEAFSINFYCYDEDQIRQLVFSISTDILKDRLDSGSDIQTEVVKNFVTRLRDEIDQISCKTDSSQRVYLAKEIDLLINSFLSTVRIERLENQGARTFGLKPLKSAGNPAQVAPIQNIGSNDGGDTT